MESVEQINENNFKQTQEKMEGIRTNPMQDIRSNPMEGIRSNPMEDIRSNPMEGIRSNPMEGNGSNPMPLGILPLPEGMRSNTMEAIRSNPIEGIRNNPMEGIGSNPTDVMNEQPQDIIKRDNDGMNDPQRMILKTEQDLKREIEDPEYGTNDMNKSFENEDMDTTAESDPTGSQEKEKKHKCGQCDKAFARSEHLKRHVASVHEGKKNFNCEFCEKAFTRSDRLKRHIAVVHEGLDGIECELCGKSYYDKSSLKKHIKRVHEGEAYPDSDFGSDWEESGDESDSFYQDDVEIDVESGEYPCGICSKQFSQPRHVKTHMIKEHSLDMNGGKYDNPWAVGHLEEFLYYCCPECNKKTQSKESFLQHAIDRHPLAKETLQMFGVKTEPYDDDWEEYNEEEGSLYYPKVEYGNGNDDNDNANTIPLQSKDSNVKSERSFKCTYCEKAFGRREHLKRHVNSVHEGTKFGCNYCIMTFSRKDYLKKHVSSVHPDKAQDFEMSAQKIRKTDGQGVQVKQEPFDENDEQMKMNQSGMYQGNIKREINDDSFVKDEPNMKFVCDTCGKEFSRRQHLKSHVNNIHKKQRKCKYCEDIFPSSELLKAHMKQAHPKIEPEILQIHTCEHCGKQFKRPSHLKVHIDTIHEGKRVNCEYCGKSFTQTSGLRSHIRNIHINEGAKNYSCEQCGKTYTSKIYLKAHIESIHEGIKRFICPVCAHPFATKANMEVHIKCVHNKIKDEICDLCGKAFGTAKELKIHKRTVHEGIKPVRVHKNIKCSFCDKVYGRPSHLRRHIITAHGGLKLLKLNDQHREKPSHPYLDREKPYL